MEYVRVMSDNALDREIDALEAAGALRVVNTSEGPKLLASSKEGVLLFKRKREEWLLTLINAWV